MDLMEIRRRLILKRKSKNLYNFATDTPNAFWRTNSPLGELVTSRPGYFASDRIRVQPNTTYTVNYNARNQGTSAGMVFWEDDHPISGVNLQNQNRVYTFTTPANCNYLTISTFSDSNNVQLEIGTEATSYEPYY